jgi:hypothetical protein
MNAFARAAVCPGAGKILQDLSRYEFSQFILFGSYGSQTKTLVKMQSFS